MQLAAHGRFDIAAPVSDVLPAFGANGKDTISVSQVLLHVGGFPYAHLGRAEITNRAARLAAYASWGTDWESGTRFEYHPATAHWVIADIITEVTGQRHDEAIAECVLDPASRISFAYLTNGLDRNDLAAARRRVALSTKALACAR